MLLLQECHKSKINMLSVLKWRLIHKEILVQYNLLLQRNIWKQYILSMNENKTFGSVSQCSGHFSVILCSPQSYRAPWFGPFYLHRWRGMYSSVYSLKHVLWPKLFNILIRFITLYHLLPRCISFQNELRSTG